MILYKGDVMKIFFAKTKPTAKIPDKRKEDAGFDLFACFDEPFLKFAPFEVKLVPTGIATAFDENYYMQIEERSSTGKINLKKNAGVVDSGYRGEIMIELFNANPCPLYISKLPKEELSTFEQEPYVFHNYDKAIAQAVLHKIPEAEISEISYDELKKIPSQRGEKGFGSTDKN